MGLMVIAIGVVLASLSVWIVLPTLAVFILFYLLRLVFLESSRDIKRIESISKYYFYVCSFTRNIRFCLRIFLFLVLFRSQPDLHAFNSLFTGINDNQGVQS